MRRVSFLVLCLLGLALCGAAPALAQGGFTGFLERLFGGEPERPRYEPDRQARPRFVPVKPRRKPRASPFATPAPQKVQEQPKEPAVAPSIFVDVIGDSLADLLAGGLSTQFADRPDIAVVSRTKASSGLVRDDFYDWDKELAKVLASGDTIAAAVILIGSNDRQPLRDNGTTYDLDTDAWRAAYVKRVDGMLAQLKAKGIKTVWVGLPPMRSPSLSAGMVSFNAIYRERCEAAGCTYVDIWDSFVNDDGDYAVSGPDLNGQITKLRLGDGVHFSKAGAQVAAHYVERELRRVLNAAPAAAAPPPTALLAPTDKEAPAAAGAPAPGAALEAPEPEKPEFGPVQPLDPVEPTAGGGLLGGAPAGPAQVATTARTAPAPFPPNADPSAARVLLRGEALAPKEGRADDFRWPRPPPDAAAGGEAPAGP
ncbi:SGNH/GDSL hydrolase family protein [Labrys wisconsinensis]|uniref:SGNH hydrolase-type esterase domain-containing protein n=1 Tax=Labrys wisconsinensis TaxID=425677 RepID=A0ABU0J1Y2_9HYPH|nr:SGNH family hydrolase [Labrys wisconsinensis]MDQ0468258.1 hypothetical protein [Labrys wisconsinensis]